MLKANDKFEKEDSCPECDAPLVNCYNLQHPAQFSDEAIEGLETALIEHLDKG